MENRFHMVRVRAAGAQGWYDPELDFRKLLPEVLERVCDTLERLFEGKPQYEAVVYIHDCIRVFQLRTLEDKKEFTSQVDDFFRAMARVPADILSLWMSQAMSAMLCIYGLFCRRDSATDRKEIKAMLDYTDATALRRIVRPETWTKLYEDVGPLLDSLLVSEKTSEGGTVVCAETGEELDNVKEIARAYLKCSSTKSWDELAALCDKAFSTRSVDSEAVGLSLLLAYPSYETPTLMAEVEREPEDQAGKAAVAGGACGSVPVDGAEKAPGGVVHPVE